MAADAPLTPADLRYLVSLCDGEVSHCGLDTEPGRRARRMGDKLTRYFLTQPYKGILVWASAAPRKGGRR